MQVFCSFLLRMTHPPQFSPAHPCPSPGSSPLGPKTNLNSKSLSSQFSFPRCLVLKTQNCPFPLDTPTFFPDSSFSLLCQPSSSSTRVTNLPWFLESHQTAPAPVAGTDSATEGRASMCSVLLGPCLSLENVLSGYDHEGVLFIYWLGFAQTANLGTVVMTFYRDSKNIWGWCHHLNLKSMLLNPWGRWDFSGSHNSFLFVCFMAQLMFTMSQFSPSPTLSLEMAKNCSWNLPAEMTQIEADTWPGKLVPKQKSNCKQMKIVLSWEVLV